MIKKITALSILLIILILPVTVFADQGIGIVLGEPTGITFKSESLVIGLGWSFATNDNQIDTTLDWWLINENLTDILDWYLGAGAKIRINLNQNTDIFNIGFRVPVGIQWWASNEIEIFGEIAPGLLLFPSTSFDISAGIGLRYYF